MSQETMKIDAVITWVDGDDPRHRQKRLKYGSPAMFNAQDIAGDTRFSSLGEIFWCVTSLNRFAPWLNKIYIVTDEQDPGLDDLIKTSFPNGHIPMEIVDHKAIFYGYEDYLPTFNSVAIEAMTWRIPGLSDCFIEFNDDLMLAAPVKPEDFFTDDNKPLCYAKKYNVAWVLFTRIFKRRIDGSKKVTFKGLMLNAAALAGMNRFFFRLEHTPKALRRDFYEKYFTSHHDQLLRNIQYRFRNVHQFTSQELQYLSLYKENKCIYHKVDGCYFYLQPKKKRNYIPKKLAKLNKMYNCKFLCFNSIDLASEADRKLILSWIENRIGTKSSF